MNHVTSATARYMITHDHTSSLLSKMILLPKSIFSFLFPQNPMRRLVFQSSKKSNCLACLAMDSQATGVIRCPTCGNPAPPRWNRGSRKRGVSRAASSCIRCARWRNGVQQLLQGHIEYFYGHRMGNYAMLRKLCSTNYVPYTSNTFF